MCGDEARVRRRYEFLKDRCLTESKLLNVLSLSLSLPRMLLITPFVVSGALFGAGQASPFDSLKNPFANKADGATTLKIGVQFSCDRGSSSVLGQLEALADGSDASTAQGIEKLAGDTALLLLRSRPTWLACGGLVRHHGDEEVALTQFDREAVSEAAKFDRETARGASKSMAAVLATGASTLAVVTALATVTGDREEAIGARERSLSGDAPAVLNALQELAAAGGAPGSVLAFELLWVPGADDDEELEMEEVTLNWPELITC